MSITDDDRFESSLRRPDGVQQALEIFSEQWAFAILQESFFGVRRFDELQASLGISRNVLSKRLKNLVGHAVLSRRIYQTKPDRFDYVLTPKGRALFPIFLAMMQWGNEWLDVEYPGWSMIHTTCGEAVTPTMVCAACKEPLKPREVELAVGPDLSKNADSVK